MYRDIGDIWCIRTSVTVVWFWGVDAGSAVADVFGVGRGSVVFGKYHRDCLRFELIA